MREAWEEGFDNVVMFFEEGGRFFYFWELRKVLVLLIVQWIGGVNNEGSVYLLGIVSQEW